MKLMVVFLAVACLSAGARGYTQSITLSLKNASLEKAFKEIRKQSGYDFIFGSDVNQDKVSITVNLKGASLQTALDKCLEGLPLTYSLQNNMIVVKSKQQPAVTAEPTPSDPPIDIKGKILTEKGEPLSGVTVAVRGTNNVTTTDANGNFELKGVGENARLDVSMIGYSAQVISVNGRSSIDVSMTLAVKQLDELIVQAYGTTTRRLNTGNIGRLNSEQIANQPVSNPLSALQGRIPGVSITQANGINGGAIKVLVRGQSSIIQGSEPLYVIDGTPFAAGNARINILDNATTSGTRIGDQTTLGMSPLNFINPSDIESIEVLKDADATAIYGSRGANGVILITMKKGKSGKTRVGLNMYTGFSTVSRTMDLLNTQQYLQMRREAFANDGITITPSNAPEILAWDTTKFYDLKEQFIGKSANNSNVELSVSGGNGNTNFLLSGGFNRATTNYATNLANKRASVLFNLSHNSFDKKLNIQFSTLFSSSKSKLPISDLASFITLPPHIRLTNEDGSINWSEGGIRFYDQGVIDHPLGVLDRVFTGEFQTMSSSLQLSYRIVPGLFAKLKLGYNFLNSDEKRISPSYTIDPGSGILPSASFAQGKTKSYNIEPQLQYTRDISKGKLDVLIGTTWQEDINTAVSILGTNYTSDALLGSTAGAGNLLTTNSYRQYRYDAIFGRVNYNWNKKYIINLSGRRDGSSRFGPERRAHNFAAAGIAWIFTEENFIQKSLPFLSFGKIRGSIGSTGNDQVGDYRFIDTWTASTSTYQGNTILFPTALFNPVLGWESTKKMEGAIDLGFWEDRILFSIAYFRARSGNQLVEYSLPIQTGFTSIKKNLEALIENRGLEITLNTINFKPKPQGLSWTTAFNISFPKQKLLNFPGLETSSYASRYVIGQPLSVVRNFQFLGVDPITGLYAVTDVDNNGVFDQADKIILSNTESKFSGGLGNTVIYKGLQFDIFFQFINQTGTNYRYSDYIPGTFRSQSTAVLNRWQKPGQVTDIQRFTSINSGAAVDAFYNMIGSNAIYSDASFIRCKNIALSYSIPAKWAQKAKMDNLKIYINAQNLFVLTDYNGSDPETQLVNALPPLKTIVFGINTNF